MAMYATEIELANYLQKTLNAAYAVQALTLASGEFRREAGTAFAATSETWTVLPAGATEIELPFNKVTAVSQVRVNGAVITGWTLRGGRLYRLAGFGYRFAYPPDEVQVDVTHGYASAPDDAKLAVLEIAAGIYDNTAGAVSETIDDYTVRYDPNAKVTVGRPWRDVAADYRGLLAA